MKSSIVLSVSPFLFQTFLSPSHPQQKIRHSLPTCHLHLARVSRVQGQRLRSGARCGVLERGNNCHYLGNFLNCRLPFLLLLLLLHLLVITQCNCSRGTHVLFSENFIERGLGKIPVDRLLTEKRKMGVGGEGGGGRGEEGGWIDETLTAAYDCAKLFGPEVACLQRSVFVGKIHGTVQIRFDSSFAGHIAICVPLCG